MLSCSLGGKWNIAGCQSQEVAQKRQRSDEERNFVKIFRNAEQALKYNTILTLSHIPWLQPNQPDIQGAVK